MALFQSVCQGSTGPVARTISRVFNLTTIFFSVVPPVVPKLWPSGGGSGVRLIGCSQHVGGLGLYLHI